MKGTWGQLQDSNSALARPTTPSRPTDQQERPLAQILGKERPLQTDSAAEAIANELDGNDQNHHVSINTKGRLCYNLEKKNRSDIKKVGV